MVASYMNTWQCRQRELGRLKENRARLVQQKVSLMQRVVNVQSTLSHISSESTRRSRLQEIERIQRDIAAVERRIADEDRKIVRQDQMVLQAQQQLEKEQMREEQNRQREAERAMHTMTNKLNEHTVAQNMMQSELADLRKESQKMTVLFLAANPNETTQIRLDEEARSIQEMIRKSEYRDSIRFETRWAVRPMDVFQAINETHPTVIHFSGHGAESGELILQDDNGDVKLVTPDVMAKVAATVADSVRLFFFNACSSKRQAESVVNTVNAAIGMSAPIDDAAACVFAGQFYSSLGFGASVKKAFDQAVARLLLEGIPDDGVPTLCAHAGVDPNDIVLTGRLN